MYGGEQAWGLEIHQKIKNDRDCKSEARPKNRENKGTQIQGGTEVNYVMAGLQRVKKPGFSR